MPSDRGEGPVRTTGPPATSSRPGAAPRAARPRTRLTRVAYADRWFPYTVHAGADRSVSGRRSARLTIGYRSRLRKLDAAAPGGVYRWRCRAIVLFLSESSEASAASANGQGLAAWFYQRSVYARQLDKPAAR